MMGDSSSSSSGSDKSFDRLPPSSSSRDTSSGPSSRVSPVHPVPYVDSELEKVRVSFESLDLVPKEDVIEEWIDVRCEPIIDILSARVVFSDALRKSSSSSSRLDVYGDIRIVDLRGSKNYIFYDRDRFECPQRLSSDSNSLQLLDFGEVPSLTQPQLVVNISNANTAATIAHGIASLPMTHHSSSPFDFEKCITINIPGEGGSRVDIQCVAFTFGVYAHVKVILFKDDDDDADKTRKEKQKQGHEFGVAQDDEDEQAGVEIFGVINAKCKPMFLPKDDDYVHDLFSVVRDEHEWVEVGTEIELWKSFVAVPAYSELEISLDLRRYEDDNDGSIVKGSVFFSPGNYNGGREVIKGRHGFYARVSVRWNEPSLLNKHWCNEDIIDGFREVPQVPGWYAPHLLEIFSMFIYRPNGVDVNLYGTVRIRDSRGWCTIFNRTSQKPFLLGRGCYSLPLQGPTRGLRPGDIFCIAVDLKDVDGYVKINGSADSSVGINERQTPWYDRRLCSVVRSCNESSFAALNYCLFAFAVQAVLSVRLAFKSVSSALVCGEMVACYDKFSYSTSYEKDFYRTVLFTRKTVDSVEVEENLELSRNLVAVPISCSLVLEVDLSFQTGDGTNLVKEIVAFQIGDDSTRAIESEIVDISIDVEWKTIT